MEEQVSRIHRTDRCFIANRECGRLLGGSTSTCFIASPHRDQVAMELDLIKSVLQTERISDYIAVEQAAYSRDVFCEKICSKIIESRFCIVMLDDKKANDTLIPNPNVYYEYGLMIAMRKEIIPMQRQGVQLPFNIQSLDVLLYTNENLRDKLTEAIRRALARTEIGTPVLPDIEQERADVFRKVVEAAAELSDLITIEPSDRVATAERPNITAGTKFENISHIPTRYLGLATYDRDLSELLIDARLICRRLDSQVTRTMDEIEELEALVARIEPQEEVSRPSPERSRLAHFREERVERLRNRKALVERRRSSPIEFLVAYGLSVLPEAITAFQSDFAAITPLMLPRPQLTLWDAAEVRRRASELGISPVGERLAAE